MPILLFIGTVSSILLRTWLSGPVQKKFETSRDALNQCRAKLSEFMESAKWLKSPIGRTIWYYDTDAVIDNFVTRAVRILDAEEKFEEVKRLEGDWLFKVLDSGHWLEKVRQDMKEAVEGVKAFGIEISQPEVFELARKHIAKMDQFKKQKSAQ